MDVPGAWCCSEMLMKLGECEPPEMLMKLDECQPPEKPMKLAQVHAVAALPVSSVA